MNGGSPDRRDQRERREPGAFAAGILSISSDFADQAMIAIENRGRSTRHRRRWDGRPRRPKSCAPSPPRRTCSRGHCSDRRNQRAPVQRAQRLDPARQGRRMVEGVPLRRHRATHPRGRAVAKIRVGGRNLPGAVVGENRQIQFRTSTTLMLACRLSGPSTRPRRAERARSAAPRCGARARRSALSSIGRDRLLPFTRGTRPPAELWRPGRHRHQNARLFTETREALERQTARADILKVIAGSPSDVQPVFEAIVEGPKGCSSLAPTTIITFEGRKSCTGGVTAGSTRSSTLNVPRRSIRCRSSRITSLLPGPSRNGAMSKFRIGEAADTSDTPRQAGRISGFRSQLRATDQRRPGIGTITSPAGRLQAHSRETAPLVQTFADQAVIAIENARLFNETQEALERQTRRRKSSR